MKLIQPQDLGEANFTSHYKLADLIKTNSWKRNVSERFKTINWKEIRPFLRILTDLGS